MRVFNYYFIPKSYLLELINECFEQQFVMRVDAKFMLKKFLLPL